MLRRLFELQQPFRIRHQVSKAPPEFAIGLCWFHIFQTHSRSRAKTIRYLYLLHTDEVFEARSVGVRVRFWFHPERYQARIEFSKIEPEPLAEILRAKRGPGHLYNLVRSDSLFIQQFRKREFESKCILEDIGTLFVEILKCLWSCHQVQHCSYPGCHALQSSTYCGTRGLRCSMRQLQDTRETLQMSTAE
ncbi:hypothetical protein TQ29_12230 [Actibacterium sp. EMB200-NS6]|nr:hypothetical protein TQ29_12230 [Actibacterium sp. EMB200-NS6]